MGRAERAIENYLVVCVEKYNGYCFKLTGYKGIPDRLVLLPGRPVIFCELKAADGTISSAQLVMIARLRNNGHIAETVFCKDDVDQLLARAMEDKDAE